MNLFTKALKLARHINFNGSCWIFEGNLDSFGYGIISWEGKPTRVHRLVYELAFGGIKEGFYICHKCDVPSCVNPLHLFQGTQKDNVKDMIKKGRSHDRRGVLNPKAKLNWDQVNKIREDYKTGLYSYQVLADTYGVAKTTISHILCGRSW